LRGFRLAAAAALIGAISPTLAVAQSFPNKPLRIMVPFGSGSGVDIISRIVAEGLSAELKQPVIVENREGAGGVIGTQAVLRLPADGYTVLTIPNTFLIAPQLNRTPPFDPIHDFTALAKVAYVPMTLVVGGQSQFRTAKDLIDYMKANPGKVSYATSGKGAQSQLEAEYMNQYYGLTAVDVPYKAAAASIADTITGTVAFYITGWGSLAANIASGKLRALAVGATQRLAAAPDVPTFVEATGIPNYVPTSWFGFVVRSGTPAPAVSRLEEALIRSAAMATVRDKVQGTGNFMSVSAGKDFGAEMALEYEKWGKLITTLNLKSD
jgi:tripartite-type tricarboxylate transporter receptor subunit TctC